MISVICRTSARPHPNVLNILEQSAGTAKQLRTPPEHKPTTADLLPIYMVGSSSSVFGRRLPNTLVNSAQHPGQLGPTPWSTQPNTLSVSLSAKSWRVFADVGSPPVLVPPVRQSSNQTALSLRSLCDLKLVVARGELRESAKRFHGDGMSRIKTVAEPDGAHGALMAT
ncbi:hypothetical protein Bbelb_276980 [Branchiostoma belcheri]|nr:hypothetical protein Bbelb_276980 [Branchiostoma belcheri]